MAKTRPAAPLTSEDADRREAKAETKRRAEIARKSEVCSRLVANKDFAQFMEWLSGSLCIAPYTMHKPTEFESGRISAWASIMELLAYAKGAAKFYASMTEAQIEKRHKEKTFRVEQKENA